MFMTFFSIRLPWSLPYGSFFIELDPLSTFFLILIILLSGACAFYGKEYLLPYKNKKSLAASWIFYILLVLSMIFVVIARNAILFLIAWEVMALSSFFLVTFEHEEESVSQAGWTYLVATHVGTAFILVLFIILGQISGSLDFDSFSNVSLSPPLSTLIFLCALIGFGTKAGLIPFHIWLPEAHPAAPSHVSALMSGVMIKTGIYGLLRIVTFLGPPDILWGWILIVIGSLSGITGVLFALAQHDIKKLLAYHSIENIGIITLGMGLGLLGLSIHNVSLTILGFAGALFHTLNHSIFKALLFLAAGSVIHTTHTRDIEKWGGLLRKMPITATTFLIGALAISGLPLFNGFISEFLIYFGAFSPGILLEIPIAFASILTIGSLALMGGLAAACFTKVFGIVFLGHPRSTATTHAHDPGLLMKGPMILLAFLCIAIGLYPNLILLPLSFVLHSLLFPFGFELLTIETTLSDMATLFTTLTLFFLSFVFVLIVLWLLKKWISSHRKEETSVTWDCGYAFPSSKMQYTGSSFAQPLTTLFQFLLGTRTFPSLSSYFPSFPSFHTEALDPFKEKIIRLLFLSLEKPLFYLRRFQYGRIQLYIFYILVTLLFLLFWQTGIT